MTDEIRDETLVALLTQRGYRVTKDEDDLSDKVASVERKIDEMREEPRSPEEARYRMAEQLRDRMNESITPWHSLDLEGDDAA